MIASHALAGDGLPAIRARWTRLPSGGVRVAGDALVYEGTLVVVAYDAMGHVVRRYVVTTRSGIARAQFSVDIDPVRVSALRLMEEDMEEGPPAATVEINLLT